MVFIHLIGIMSPHPGIGHNPGDHIITAVGHIRILSLIQAGLFSKFVKLSGNIHFVQSIIGSLGRENNRHPDLSQPGFYAGCPLLPFLPGATYIPSRRSISITPRLPGKCAAPTPTNKRLT